MHPQQTFELRIAFCAPHERHKVKTKKKVMDWLLVNGVESFVEGALDVDLFHDQSVPDQEYYQEMGGDLACISVYRYSHESLVDLEVKIKKEFGDEIATSMHSMPTETWMEGWKESFKSFSTDLFYVCPPWIKEAPPKGKISLIIEPGMAFGTGQHGTTKVCLNAIEKVGTTYKDTLAEMTLLDVGTGTGILAIAARLLGFGSVAGTDIEDDAVTAAIENARVNQADILVRKGSLPEGGPFHVVVANILAVTLLRMMDDLNAVLKPGGQLIMSGLLNEEEGELIERAKGCGLIYLYSERLEGWSCLVFEKLRA
jgi:ribosomal protein L11 methyltransferase